MAENITIYPGRHFTIDDIGLYEGGQYVSGGVYLSNIDLTSISWSTVSTEGHSTPALQKSLDGQTATSVTFYQDTDKIFDNEAFYDILPFFNVIAIFHEEMIDGAVKYELLTYGLLGTIQETKSTSRWEVIVQLEWTSELGSTIINLSKVYLEHTQQTSAISEEASQTIDQVHEKLIGLGAQDVTSRAQRIAFFYDNKVCNEIETLPSESPYVQYLDAGQRLTNNNLLFKADSGDSFDFGDIDPIVEVPVDSTTDISNGGMVLYSRGGAVNYLDDVITYYLDAKRTSYIPDENDNSHLDKVSQNIKANIEEADRNKALSDFTACIIGNFVFPQLINIIYDDVHASDTTVTFEQFSDIYTKSYKKASLSFNLARGSGFFLPLDDFSDNINVRYFVYLPCGTNDFVIKILKVPKSSVDSGITYEIPNNEFFMPMLYIQQSTYFVQYENAKLLTFNVPEVTGTNLSTHIEFYNSDVSQPKTIPSNPWCFPEKVYNSSTYTWEPTNDMPEQYQYAICNCTDMRVIEGFTTVNMNDVGLLGLICEAPEDIRGLVRYYHQILDNIKNILAAIRTAGEIIDTGSFDGISYKLLEKIKNEQLIEWINVSSDTPISSGTPYREFAEHDKIRFRYVGNITHLVWSSTWELTEKELYSIYTDSYNYKHGKPNVGNINWLSHFYATIKDRVQDALIFESAINDEQQIVSSSIPISTLDWDSLSDVGNPDIEQMQFNIITQGFSRALEAIKNTFNYGVARTNSSTIKWMFFDNAIVLVDKKDLNGDLTNDYYYVTVLKYSDKYGSNLFRQVIPSTQIDDLRVTYSSDILTLKFDSQSELSQKTGYTSLYDLNVREPHKPVASVNSAYYLQHSDLGTNTLDYMLVRDLYYSNGVLFETENNSPTNGYYYQASNTSNHISWTGTNGIKLLRKIFYDFQQ